MERSPIGPCGKCEDCHAYTGPEDSVLLSTRDIPIPGPLAWTGKRATASEIRSALNISEIEIDDARRAIKETAMQENSEGPPPMPVTGDNWRLTPLTDMQFDFVYEAVTREREDRAALIAQVTEGIPVLQGVLPGDLKTEEIPVLTWASPKEMERLIEFAHRMREERNEARLIANILKAMVMKQGTSKQGVEQAIKDVLTLGEQIDRNLADTPAVRGYRFGSVGKVPMELP